MKGIVFTEFLDLVENKFGIETLQKIIDECELSTNGVYTSVGTYDHKDMFKMVGKLSEIKNIPVADLLQSYGEFFFTVLSSNYPKFMEQKTLFTFLDSIDNYIHPEVLKLYPDAELPKFKAIANNKNSMQLIYESSRKMADFAIGLIRGASTFYNEKLNELFIERIEENGAKVHIKITRD